MNYKLLRFLVCAALCMLDVYLAIIAMNVLRDPDLAQLFYFSAILLGFGTAVSYFSLDPDDRK